MTSSWVFLRHGQSEGNVARRLVGPAQSPLTELGVAQARACLPSLRQLGIQSISASPMRRARQTAEVASEGLGGLRIDLQDGLAERSFGELDGWTVEAVKASRWTHTRTAWRAAAPGGETLAEVALRALRALVRPQPAPRLIVAHAGTIRAVVGLLDGVDASRIGRIRVPHCRPWVRTVSASRVTRLVTMLERSA